jgi:hypothetical protein
MVPATSWTVTIAAGSSSRGRGSREQATDDSTVVEGMDGDRHQ